MSRICNYGKCLQKKRINGRFKDKIQFEKKLMCDFRAF